MRHSTERLVTSLVFWLIRRFLFHKFRLVTPEDLEKVVNDYLSDLQKIGVRLVYDDKSKVGESNDKVEDSSPGA